ncbi:lipopolysaccharide heptosyltransferase III [Serratia sp. AS12]|uniref:putative lipopolysaccharide heptosyltransferase III n=1 Tax=Serratia TaxID=613 RepID=UPI00020EA276|nr:MULTISPECIES: putative lipopolysaccharide heptosyltransferase III [Serratia]AEF48022.1 lipopolysaccharide heptosyltransferase III [Serratia plymuthica AS9]AEF52974.1 lipopolysaccharide heptosyltransferase III [Serratia sp. AS12]AEG30681.1 lipopolysaccharide heptosyltransferase III [Serratia sp. AS13]UTN96655.1 putative lipopolysaccharide heptosyltransferase III [Serratia plymuthica]
MMNDAPALAPDTSIQRILIVKLRHHGDMLLVTPVINSLQQNYPQAQIDVLLYKETQDMLASHPALSNVFVIDRQWKKQGTKAHLRHELNLIRQLKGQRYDLVVNLADQWRSAIIARLTGSRIRLGFDLPKRRGFLWRHCHTHLVPVSDHARLHTVEQNLSLLQPLGLPALSQQVTMSYPPQDWQTCEQLLRQQGITGDYIVVQPTSRWFFKCWSEEKMAATVSALQADGHRLVITSGPDTKEREMVERILALCPPQGVVSLAGQLTLRQLAALIDHAKLFIGVDSVPMHMAAALQTPCIALFGPSKLVFWRPWQVNGCVIWAGDFGTLPDPDAINTGTDERYLDLIPTDAVIAAARSRLA